MNLYLMVGLAFAAIVATVVVRSTSQPEQNDVEVLEEQLAEMKAIAYIDIKTRDDQQMSVIVSEIQCNTSDKDKSDWKLAVTVNTTDEESVIGGCWHLSEQQIHILLSNGREFYITPQAGWKPAKKHRVEFNEAAKKVAPSQPKPNAKPQNNKSVPWYPGSTPSFQS